MDNCSSGECNICPDDMGSFEYLVATSSEGALMYNQDMIEKIILNVCDRFNCRFVRGQAARAVALSAGLTIIGTVVGRQLAGNTGAMIGASAAGACGVGIAVLSMREAWPSVKNQLNELYDVVYDYVGNMGFDDYAQILRFLSEHSSSNQTQLGEIIVGILKNTLGQQSVLSSLTP